MFLVKTVSIFGASVAFILLFTTIDAQLQLSRLQYFINKNFIKFGNANQTKPVRHDGAQLWKLHTQQLWSKPLVKLQLEFGGDVWSMNEDGIDIYLKEDVLDDVKVYLDGTDITYNIMIDNIQQAMEEANVPVNSTGENDPLQGTGVNMSWNQFHSYEDINDFFFYLLEYFPDICSIMSIGRSAEKRELKMLRISNHDPDNRAVFIDAGMQGREWVGPAALTYIMQKMALNWRKMPPSVKAIDWYFVPLMNPDGYEYSRNVDRFWSKNRRVQDGCPGVNLDRNFDYSWGGKGSSGEPCSRYFRGPEKFSEPETRAVRNILTKMKGYISGYISLGGYGQFLAYPWGDEDYVPGNFEEMHYVAKRALRNMQKVVGTEYKAGSSYSLQFARSGNSADWVLNTLNINFVYNLMLRDQGQHGYIIPSIMIEDSGEEAFAMVKTIAERIYRIQLYGESQTSVFEENETNEYYGDGVAKHW